MAQNVFLSEIKASRIQRAKKCSSIYSSMLSSVKTSCGATFFSMLYETCSQQHTVNGLKRFTKAYTHCSERMSEFTGSRYDVGNQSIQETNGHLDFAIEKRVPGVLHVTYNMYLKQ